MKHRIKISESKLRRIINEAVKSALNINEARMETFSYDELERIYQQCIDNGDKTYR